MKKKYFFNSASDRSKVVRLERGGGVTATVPDGECLTIKELVSMTMRGQDISPYLRSNVYGQFDEDPNHDQVDLESFQRLDFSERLEFAREHSASLIALKQSIDDVLLSEKVEVEKHPVVPPVVVPTPVVVVSNDVK